MSHLCYFFENSVGKMGREVEERMKEVLPEWPAKLVAAVFLLWPPSPVMSGITPEFSIASGSAHSAYKRRSKQRCPDWNCARICLLCSMDTFSYTKNLNHSRRLCLTHICSKAVAMDVTEKDV